MFNAKVVFIGESGVGKSTLVDRIINDRFNLNIEASIGAYCCVKVREIEGETYKLTFWDTAGSSRYLSLLPVFLKGADIVCICVDPYRPKIDVFISEALKTCPDALFYIVSMKNDNGIVYNKDLDEASDKLPDIDFFHTSAKTAYGVDDLVDSIYKHVSKNRQEYKIEGNITLTSKEESKRYCCF